MRDARRARGVGTRSHRRCATRDGPLIVDEVSGLSRTTECASGPEVARDAVVPYAFARWSHATITDAPRMNGAQTAACRAVCAIRTIRRRGDRRPAIRAVIDA